MTVARVSELVYLSVFIVWLTLELLGLSRRSGLPIPWFTNSETVWTLEAHRLWVRILVFAVCEDLTSHLVFGTDLFMPVRLSSTAVRILFGR